MLKACVSVTLWWVCVLGCGFILFYICFICSFGYSLLLHFSLVVMRLYYVIAGYSVGYDLKRVVPVGLCLVQWWFGGLCCWVWFGVVARWTCVGLAVWLV